MEQSSDSESELGSLPAQQIDLSCAITHLHPTQKAQNLDLCSPLNSQTPTKTPFTNENFTQDDDLEKRYQNALRIYEKCIQRVDTDQNNNFQKEWGRMDIDISEHSCLLKPKSKESQKQLIHVDLGEVDRPIQDNQVLNEEKNDETELQNDSCDQETDQECIELK